MDPEYSRIIGLEVVTDNLFETDAIREFLQKEQASVGRKFAAIEKEVSFTIDIGISPLCFGFDCHLNLNIAEILFLC